MANKELGDPDTLDRDVESSGDGVFDEGASGVARPNSNVLRDKGSREVPKTRPMASLDEFAISQRIAKRKLGTSKAQVTVIEAGEPVPPLRLENPITDEPEVPLAVLRPTPEFTAADTIRTDSGPAVEWDVERKGGLLPFLMVLALVLVGVLFLFNAGPSDELGDEADPVARAAEAAQSQAPPAVEKREVVGEPAPVAVTKPAPEAKPEAKPEAVAVAKPPPAAKPAPRAKPAPKPLPTLDPANSTAVTIHADPPDASLAVDGRPVGIAPYLGSFEPGAIVMIEAKAAGYATTLRAIKVGDQSSSVVVKLLPE